MSILRIFICLCLGLMLAGCTLGTRQETRQTTTHTSRTLVRQTVAYEKITRADGSHIEKPVVITIQETETIIEGQNVDGRTTVSSPALAHVSSAAGSLLSGGLTDFFTAPADDGGVMGTVAELAGVVGITGLLGLRKPKPEPAPQPMPTRYVTPRRDEEFYRHPAPSPGGAS